MKIVEFLIDETQETGVKTISLVDQPAMESSFISFKEDKKQVKYIALAKNGEGEYKQVVAGLSLIPDKLIYRVDPDTGEEYNGYFSQDTIEKIRNKYHKEMMTSNVNLDHDENSYIDAYLIESYILNTEARVEEVKAQGIEEATIGAWYTQFKIEDAEVFQQVLDGDFNGFSIEAYLNKSIAASLKNKFKEKEKKMKKSIVQKFKDFLETLEAEETQVEALESALVPELDVTINWTEAEAEVTKTYTNEDGDEVTEPVGQGEFVLEDGRIVVVDENSMLIEVQDAPAEEDAPAEDAESSEEEAAEQPVEEIPTEEVVEETKDEEMAEDVVAEESTEEVAEESTEEKGMPAEVVAWLSKIAGDFEDGEIYVSFMKQSGELTYGSVSTYANIAMTKENMTKITELEEKLSEPAADPKLTDTTVSSGEVKELTVYEKVMKRKGLA